MAARIFRRLRDLLDVDTAAAVPGDALVLDVDGETWVPGAGGGGTDDQTAAEVPFTPAGNLASTDVQDALEELDAEKAATSHAHSGADITSGTVADARIASTIARDSEVTAAVSASEAGQVRDGDAAGGVLGGTYPNPSFAADMATQAELDAHLTDAADAHDASAISIADAGNDFTATDVEGALAELQSDHETDAQNLADHLADATAAHAATAIAFTPDGSIAATTVQAAIVEVRDEAGGGGAPTTADYLVGTAQGGLSAEIVVGTTPGGELGGTWGSPTVDASHSGSTHAAVQAAAEATAAAALSAHLTDTSDAHDASAISADSTTLVGTGTDVQAVLEELDNGIADHLADAADAHDASAISVLDSAGVYAATDVEGVLAEIGVWQAFTPVLTASTTNPTLGTGGSIVGRYCKIGNSVLFRVRVLFGSASVNGGSGTYRITLGAAPTPDDDLYTNPIIGQVTIFDSSPSTFRIGTVQFDSANGYFVMQVDSATGNVTHNSPITFAANDQILITGFYEVD